MRVHGGLSLVAMLMLAACGGGGAAVNPTPPPPPAPTPTPTPPPGSPNNTTEYQRSNAAVAAGAITAYDQGITGAGVTVAVIDSGINPVSPEFAGRLSALSRDVASNRPMGDERGHGTSVTGIIAAARNGALIQGVAYGATIVALRADTPGSCTGGGSCTYSATAVATGIDAAVAANARVINISLGGPTTSSLERAAVSRAVNAGLVIVNSAGNDGNPDPDGMGLQYVSLGRSNVILAGAIDAGGNIASFSNRAGSGASNFLTALGAGVRSFDQNGDTFLYSGTSVSAPVITGAVALLAQAFPNLSGAQIVDILFRSADDLGAPGTDAVFGRGALNITRAMSPIGGMFVSQVADPLTLGGALGAPLGDAGATGKALGAVPVSDAYGRAYTVNLAATLRSAAPGRLAMRLLSAPAETAVVGAGNSAVAFGWTGDVRNWAGDRATGAAFARSDVQPVAPIGHVRLAMPGGRMAVLGHGEDAARLLDMAGSAPLRPDTLVATDTLPLGARALGGLAWAQPVGGFTASVAMGVAELPATRLDRAARQTRALVRLERQVGSARLAVTAEMMTERGAMLGSRLSPSFGIDGATTMSGGVGFAVPLAGWELAGEGRLSTTRADLSNGLISRLGALSGQSGWLGLSRGALFTGGDRLSFTVARPLRASGTAMLVTADAPLLLAPSGRETVWEAGYALPLAGGTLDLGLYRRDQPGHVLTAPPDHGGAIRLRLHLQ